MDMEQQQKDFMSTFFPQDSSSNQEFNTQSIPMFPFSSGTSSHHTTMGMQQSMQPNMNPQINVDHLTHMQGIDNATVSPQSSYNSQSLLEQQFKLSQLQQLQQLQNQIFQQQASVIFTLFPMSLRHCSPIDCTHQWSDCRNHTKLLSDRCQTRAALNALQWPAHTR